MTETSELDLEKEIQQIELTKPSEECVFKLNESDFNLPLRIDQFFSEKEFDYFIKNVEKLVRHSNEYRVWLEYIIQTLENTECALTHERVSECKLEVHHHPVPLYTICKAVIVEFLSKKMKFSTFDVATKVIELHYQNKIGYILLLSDIHNKYHSGFQKLPIELVRGNYRYILGHYAIDEQEHARICELCNIHAKDCSVAWERGKYPGIEEISK